MVAGRTLAIGDIHGSDVALETLVRELSLKADDTLVVLGDVVDRGPGSRQAVEQLLRCREDCRVVLILGNHEEMMVDALALAVGTWTDDWLRFGGAATVTSYGGEDYEVPQEHFEFLQSGLDYWQTDSALFVHANLEPGVPLAEQTPEWLRWTHLTGRERPHPSGRRVICGHTPQKSGIPLVRAGWVCVDTFAWGGGWLTALDVDADEFVQTNQSGEIRYGRL